MNYCRVDGVSLQTKLAPTRQTGKRDRENAKNNGFRTFIVGEVLFIRPRHCHTASEKQSIK